MKKLLLMFSCMLVFAGGCANAPDKQLLGTWLQPLPTDPTQTRGFEFKKHGQVVSINPNVINYNSWRISDNNILILSGNDRSTGSPIFTKDYYTITKLDNSMLVLKTTDGRIEYYTHSQ